MEGARGKGARRRLAPRGGATALLATHILGALSLPEAPVVIETNAALELRGSRLRIPSESSRHLQAAWRRLNPAPPSCPAVALRLMPTPALRSYEDCYLAKLSPQTTHNWSTPGAEAAAVAGCWCKNNLTQTIQEYGCCAHSDFAPMCTIDCEADCSSALAQTCVQSCPAMCFEAEQFIVERTACNQCDWTACWPFLQCILRHAETQVQAGAIEQTCHEVDFENGAQLKEYWKCWRDGAKHTSQWNILASMAHCICREGLKDLAKETSCCNSVIQGAGVCDLECRTEAECNSQEAQTCIHMCKHKCPAFELVASAACRDDCLANFTGCHRYVTCKPHAVVDYICDDGRWPNGATGCCTDPQTGAVGCPRLCETQTTWRLDGPAAPWWLRWHGGGGVVRQCTCAGCPLTSAEGAAKLTTTIEQGVWDNGQVMLVDIARREGLQLGPNRRMQELMQERNERILSSIQVYGPLPNDRTEAEIEAINDRYANLITTAARTAPDDGGRNRKAKGGYRKAQKNNAVLIVVVASACTVCLVAAISLSTWCIIMQRIRAKKTAINEIQGPQVVMGNPVRDPATVSGEIVATAGAPVTVMAPVLFSKPQAW